MKRYGICLFFIVLSAFMFGISFSAKERMIFIFDYTSYVIIFLMVLIWAISGVNLIRFKDINILKLISDNYVGFIAALLLSLVVFLTVKTDFRTLSDETNLLSISKSMFSQKGIRNITSGEYYYDNFRSLEGKTPRRPFVYPFFTAMVHTLIGYRQFNGFVVNYITLFFFLAGIFILVKRYTDDLSAISALFLFLSQPVIPLYAASSGFDFINAFFFCLAFTMLLVFMRHPSKEKFAFMWMTFLMLCNIRYESVVSLFIAMAGLLLLRYIKWETIKTNLRLICFTPILMLPFVLQRILMLNNNENPAGVALFSLGHFIEHLKTFITTQFDFSFYLPYANLLNLISLPCIGWLVYRMIRYRGVIPSSTFHFIMLFALSVLANLAVIFCFYFGKNTHPVSARYFILIALVFSLAPLWLKKLHPTLLRSEILLIFSLGFFFLYHPVAIEDRFTNTLTLNREYREARAFVNTLDDKRILVVYHRPGQFTALDFGAVNFSYANTNSGSLLGRLDRGLFSNIIVMQRIQYSDKKPIDGCDLSNKFALQKIKEIQVTQDFFLRISKVRKNQAGRLQE